MAQKENPIFRQMGASSHTDKERQKEDYYATDPAAAEWLLKLVDLPKDKPIWECAAGEDYLANVFREHGYEVRSSDIVKRLPTTEIYDFMQQDGEWDGSIVTNPPYNIASKFVEKTLQTATKGNYVCMFLKIQFLEGKERKNLFKRYPPKYVCVTSSRMSCAMNGDFEKYPSSAVAYAWFIWEKGYQGDTVLKWFN